MSVCTLLPYPREIKHPEKPRKSRKAKAPNGYVIYEDSVRVAIATGFRRPSVNAKTGPMLQVWILIKKENPLAAYQSGADVDICGRCPAHEICYVEFRQSAIEHLEKQVAEFELEKALAAYQRLKGGDIGD